MNVRDLIDQLARFDEHWEVFAEDSDLNEFEILSAEQADQQAVSININKTGEV